MRRRMCMAAVVTALLPIGLLAPGCLERKERIAVKPDGTVSIGLAFRTKSFDELNGGDAMPSAEGGWLVREFVDRDREGQETFRLEAEAEFPPQVSLPDTWAGPREPDPDLFLHFPTTVTIEDRPDGTWYHFRRRYPARPWAQLEGTRHLLEQQVKGLSGRAFEDLDAAERGLLVQAGVRFETMKSETFARAAFLDTLEDARQDLWLAVHRTLAAEAENFDVRRLLEAGVSGPRRTG